MKKKMSIIFVCLMMVVLTACGSNNEKNEAENTSMNKEAVTEAVENTTVDVEETTKEDVVEKISDNDNMVEIIIGGDKFPVNDNERFSLSVFPEIYLLFPTDVITDITPDDVRHDAKVYSINTETDLQLKWQVYMSGYDDEYCGGNHIDRIDYGRYSIDYNRCSIAIVDCDAETAIVMCVATIKDHSDEAYTYLEKVVSLNVEYLKQQMSSWDESYEAPAASNNEAVDDGTRTYVSMKGDTIKFEGLDTDSPVFSAVDCSGYNYKHPLVIESDTLYKAMDGDTVVLTFELTETGLFCDTDYDFYCNLYDTYELVTD